MRAVSIDIETLGLEPWSPVIQIGAAIFDINSEPGKMVDTLQFYVWDNDFDSVEPYAAAMNSEILYAIASVRAGDFHNAHPSIYRDGDYPGLYVQRDNAIKYLNDFIGSKVEGKPVLCGKNFAKFDRPMLLNLGDLVPHHHRFPDPGNLFWRPEVDGAVLPDSKTCMERAGLAGEVAHTALEDAVMAAKMIQVWANDHSN